MRLRLREETQDHKVKMVGQLLGHSQWEVTLSKTTIQAASRSSPPRFSLKGLEAVCVAGWRVEGAQT